MNLKNILDFPLKPDKKIEKQASLELKIFRGSHKPKEPNKDFWDKYMEMKQNE